MFLGFRFLLSGEESRKVYFQLKNRTSKAVVLMWSLLAVLVSDFR